MAKKRTARYAEVRFSMAPNVVAKLDTLVEKLRKKDAREAFSTADPARKLYLIDREAYLSRTNLVRVLMLLSLGSYGVSDEWLSARMYEIGVKRGRPSGRSA